MLYDCSDTKCREVLQHVVDGTEPGHSKLLVFEYGTPLFPALLDIQMLAMSSGMERTEMQWREAVGEFGAGD
jgi:hypothetical protein